MRGDGLHSGRGSACYGRKFENVRARCRFEAGEGRVKGGEVVEGIGNRDKFQARVTLFGLGFVCCNVHIGVDGVAAMVVEGMGLVGDGLEIGLQEGTKDILKDEGTFGVESTDILKNMGGKAFLDCMRWSRGHMG